MRSVVVRRFGGPEVLEVVEVPFPVPGPLQVRVRVAAAAVNRIDISTRTGALVEAGLMAPAPEYPLGWDVAGTVDEAGPGVDTTMVGDLVVGLRDVLSAGGTYAEHVLLDVKDVASAPTTIPLAEAAALPMAALTADQALDLSGAGPGQTLLVTGAAGGVGRMLLQLARARGVHVVAVAAQDDESDLRGLGAVAVVPRTVPVSPAVRELVPGGVDGVIDAAVLGISAHEALRGGGTFVALVRPFAPPPLRGTHVHVQEVRADGHRLAELAAMVDAGQLDVRVADSFALTEVAGAHARFEAGGVRGRLLLLPHVGC